MLVFFYLADYEILELSEAKLNLSRILDILDLELRMLVLLVAMDDCVVLSPSHYREEEICRELMRLNRPFINEGWLGLVMREANLQDNEAKQAKRYEHYLHLDKYRQAYLLHTDYGLKELGFRILSKDFKTGKMSMDIWEQKIRALAISADYPSTRLNELIRRIRDNENAPFIWERVKAILDSMDFSAEEERLLKIRANMSTSYIEAHQSERISLPCGTMAVREMILPQTGRDNAYDLMRFRRVLQQAEIFDNIAGFGPEKILALKAKSSHIMDEIRKANKAGDSSEQIFANLSRKRLIKDLIRTIKGIDRKMPIYHALSDVETFLEEQTEVIEKLAKTFIKYQHPDGKTIDRKEIKRFLRQFETSERMSLALLLLQNIIFIDRNKMKEMFRHYWEQILSPEQRKRTILTNIGGPYDSSHLVSYFLGDIIMKFTEAIDLRAILDSMNPSEKEILFVDDNIGSGKQARGIFRQLLGLPEKRQFKETHEYGLTKTQIIMLKKYKLRLFTLIGFEEGKKELIVQLRNWGLKIEEDDIYSFLRTEEKIGCFHPASPIFYTIEERDACKAMCKEIGYQLFYDKTTWPDELRKERSLGYGNSQKLIVFFYNVPTATLPMLWKKGKYNNKEWIPLFPRRPKR